MIDKWLRELQDWFANHCDGQWEHHHGVKIESCDNPGWWVKIDLLGTELQDRPFLVVAENINPGGFPESDRWLHCHVEQGVWHGAGDELKLALILQLFLQWANGEPG